MTVLLSGCMEALQNSQNTGSLPPSSLPAATDPMVPSVPVAVATQTTDVLLLEPSPTVVTLPEPTPTASATATILLEQPSPIAETPFVLSTPLPLTNEQRWRAQEINRIVIEPQRIYTTSSSELWWFDPINQQHVILGTFTGDFLAQAQFTLRSQGVAALEVPYQVNKSYGLTALSPAIVARIAATGSGEWIETYVFVTPNIVPR